jgi:hypothetical protein
VEGVIPSTVEAALAHHIREKWIQTGKDAVKRTMQMLVKIGFSSLRVEEMRRERFATSANRLDGFLARQGFSICSPHPARRRPINHEHAAYFLDATKHCEL